MRDRVQLPHVIYPVSLLDQFSNGIAALTCDRDSHVRKVHEPPPVPNQLKDEPLKCNISEHFSSIVDNHKDNIAIANLKTERVRSQSVVELLLAAIEGGDPVMRAQPFDSP